MTAFTDGWLARFRDRVNADPEMAVIGDWFSTSFSLTCGDRRCIVRFEKGRLVELSPTEIVFANPKHPYTRRLIGAVPVVTAEEAELRDRLTGKFHLHVAATALDVGHAASDIGPSSRFRRLC